MYVNKAIVEGRCGRDAEARAAGSSVVANVSLAVTERYRTRGGDDKEVTNWIPVVAWGDLAEELGRARKGDRVFVEGTISTRSYEKDGQKRNVVEVKASYVKVLADHEEEQQRAPAAPPQQQSRRAPAAAPAPSGGKGRPVDDLSDIPF